MRGILNDLPSGGKAHMPHKPSQLPFSEVIKRTCLPRDFRQGLFHHASNNVRIKNKVAIPPEYASLVFQDLGPVQNRAIFFFPGKREHPHLLAAAVFERAGHALHPASQLAVRLADRRPLGSEPQQAHNAATQRPVGARSSQPY